MLFSFNSLLRHVGGYFIGASSLYRYKSAPQWVVYTKAGTALGRSMELSFDHSSSSHLLKKAAAVIPLSIPLLKNTRNTQEISWEGKHYTNRWPCLQAEKSCLCLALIFQSHSPRGEAVWFSSFLAFPMARCIQKELGRIPSAEERELNKQNKNTV